MTEQLAGERAQTAPGAGAAARHATVVQDLADETAALRAVLADLPDADWELPTPAQDWAIRDQVSHLAYFDGAAVRSVRDPDGFAAEIAAMMAGTPLPGRSGRAEEFRDMSAPELLAWSDTARAELLECFGGLHPRDRVIWYGPSMSAKSMVTARLMETWAHGTDVLDAVGAPSRPSSRLRHVAHIGIAARGFAFRTNGQPVPTEPVRVELDPQVPDETTWEWGPVDAADRVTGTALDFCLLVTQRRHRADTALVAQGPVADAWLDLAQAFAGPPGAGRAPDFDRWWGDARGR
ncbi:TIGR03084 family metal-binding protein [Nakamurella leprariae]|uniref:TIGR03084 family protein n=1 Tax=Nakamurella leprariae TaxID=2803911 RepID=A0A938YD16_9ACTN|nr:TIGR03084 family metal-binding protein [Nakamurella leprariae]MBM9467599.1 TIGR03084 family protein [Nakamurella leprariae]